MALLSDKGEIGSSSLPRPTIPNSLGNIEEKEVIFRYEFQEYFRNIVNNLSVLLCAYYG